MVGKLSLKVETVRNTPALSGCFETTRWYERLSDNETLSDKSRNTESEHEFVTATESEREETHSVEGSTESKQSGEMTSSSEEENTKDGKKKKCS